jgi:hypothetical protein
VTQGSVSSGFVTVCRNWTSVRGAPLGLAVTLACALAVTSCTSSARPASSGAAASGSARPGITLAQARQVWDRYLATGAQVEKAESGALALPTETGPFLARAAASVTVEASILKAARGANSLTSVSVLFLVPDGAPAFYLPEQSGYPRFFVAKATNKYASGTSPVLSTPQSDDGAQLYLRGPQLLLFEQARAGASWLLADVSTLAIGETVPRLATDRAGYIPTVPLSDTSLLTKPEDTGPLQAAVVDDGPASAATRAVSDGQLTTGLYRGAVAHDDELAPPAGDDYQWELEGASYPQFALRTAAGGALVFYAMSLTTTVAVPDVINKADPVQPGPPIQVPLDVKALLPENQATPHVELSAEQILTFAAIDPPAGTAKVEVISMGGGLTAASAS